MRLLKKNSPPTKRQTELQTELLVGHLELADTYFDRARGLIGRRSLELGHGLWIKRCNSIHTFFMRFPIDVVFLDSSMHVVHIYRNLKPWRITCPRLRATSVVEAAAGMLPTSLQPGDELYVES